ncbi:hypothetical protein D6D01_00450 [Aureobasidium pullulans]|uniref:Uncharacterized protein n=1 Tax=Aureobasidium pullulans TaxID=5580 RepID=A0A4S9M227_AURPU|nr:hypothetical protein D6D01_00450 [Aureobasidium pullulans]
MVEPNTTPTTRTDWAARVRAAMELFNEERYHLCEVEVRALLAYAELPQYYHVQCLVILATCVGNWSEGKQHQECAENMWSHMRLVWPIETASERKNHAFLQLRGMLDDLKEDMDATEPASQYEVRFKKSEVESLDNEEDMSGGPTENEQEIVKKEEKVRTQGGESGLFRKDDSEDFQDTKSKQSDNHGSDDDSTSSVFRPQNMKQSDKAFDTSDYGSIENHVLSSSRIDQPKEEKSVKANDDAASSRSPTKSNRHIPLERFLTSSTTAGLGCVTDQAMPKSPSSFSMAPFMPELTEKAESSTSNSWGGSLRSKLKDKTHWRFFKNMSGRSKRGSNAEK